MAEPLQQGLAKVTNRVSRFPRTENGDTSRSKRHLDELETVVRGTKQSVQRLQKRQATPEVFTPFSKEVASPWRDYQKSFKLNQAGNCLVVHAKNATFEEGILKEIRSYGKEKMSNVISYSHKNLVKLRRAFYDDEAIFLLYEMMDVTLAQIFNSPLGRLQLYEVAAFSQEILRGIEYIHNCLKISHGDITSESILLSVSGAIKIANLGASMLQKSGSSVLQEDLKSMGKIIIECLEPATFLKQESSLKSKSWESDIVDFIESTKSKSAQFLLQHDFLKLSPGPSCLKPYIRMAREVGAKEVEMVI
ncbi:hypothetical protein F1880_005511 [Penicillium rolfsii]|nr:hypothetical protein F1880_005511 [Penicillium rolfsii]